MGGFLGKGDAVEMGVFGGHVDLKLSNEVGTVWKVRNIPEMFKVDELSPY